MTGDVDIVRNSDVIRAVDESRVVSLTGWSVVALSSVKNEEVSCVFLIRPDYNEVVVVVT